MTHWTTITAGANRERRDIAAQLLAQRERGYPPAIAAGRLSQADADTKLRIMRAVVAVWTAMAENRDLPAPADWPASFGASAGDMLAELRLAYAAVRRVAEAANVGDDDPRWTAVFNLSTLIFDHEEDMGGPRLCRHHADYQTARALALWRGAA